MGLGRRNQDTHRRLETLYLISLDLRECVGGTASVEETFFYHLPREPITASYFYEKSCYFISVFQSLSARLLPLPAETFVDAPAVYRLKDTSPAELTTLTSLMLMSCLL